MKNIDNPSVADATTEPIVKTNQANFSCLDCPQTFPDFLAAAKHTLASFHRVVKEGF